MIFRLAPFHECYIYFIIPNFILVLSKHGVGSYNENIMGTCYEWMNNISHKRVVFVNSLSAPTGRDRHLNKSCHNN